MYLLQFDDRTHSRMFACNLRALTTPTYACLHVNLCAMTLHSHFAAAASEIETRCNVLQQSKLCKYAADSSSLPRAVLHLLRDRARRRIRVRHTQREAVRTLSLPVRRPMEVPHQLEPGELCVCSGIHEQVLVLSPCSRSSWRTFKWR